MSFTQFARLGAALAAAVSLAACQGAVAGPSRVPASAGGSVAIEANAVWTLRSLVHADGSVVAIEDPSAFTLTLTDDGKLQARADCNRATGGYTISGNRLSVGPIASTKAYCASAPLDDQYLTLLSGENVVALSGASLQLSSPRGALRFGR